ncbi:hypothetical protein BJ322DRAFT_1112865 [Thelephora terrestris]|uniref:Uncharacterized protein n=1 Tax=Thelephora terrestris TaxID=56493 RepID=A0A9P6H5Y8_9AGAM|nr:hypothetical protein BJ322DRAFT_1112865 [Thelephora terrestris]
MNTQTPPQTPPDRLAVYALNALLSPRQLDAQFDSSIESGPDGGRPLWMGRPPNDYRLKLHSIHAVSLMPRRVTMVSRKSSGHFSEIGQHEFVRVSSGSFVVYGVKQILGVMEGYSTDRAELLQDERADLGGGVAETAQIFQSSRDINRRVLRHWTPSPFSSPKKRSRYDYEVEEALEEEGEGEEMEIDHLVANLQSLAEGISHRPMKPLRRTLFTDTSKPIIPQNHNMCTNHDAFVVADESLATESESPRWFFSTSTHKQILLVGKMVEKGQASKDEVSTQLQNHPLSQIKKNVSRIKCNGRHLVVVETPNPPIIATAPHVPWNSVVQWIPSIPAYRCTFRSPNTCGVTHQNRDSMKRHVEEHFRR